MFVLPAVVLAVMGAGFLLAGWQGFRIELNPEAAAFLDEAELRRRRIMIRAGSYACLLSGSVLVVLAGVVTYEVLAVLGHRW